MKLKKTLSSLLISLFAAAAIPSFAFAQDNTGVEEEEISQTEFNKLNQVSEKDGKEADSPKAKKITFSTINKRPVGSARISSKYGYRKHPVLKRKIFHHGVDFAVKTGTPIKAAEDGKVIFYGRLGGYGNLMVIKHNKEFSTLYAHLSKMDKKIKVGQTVKAGQVVAYSGNTGRSTGPHLHFEVRKNGYSLNPLTGKSGGSKDLLTFRESGRKGVNAIPVSYKAGKIKKAVKGYTASNTIRRIKPTVKFL